eukprot:TRINITY_DN4390_c0_g2_i1.p1 TRINITY_DN4390_c0_g2~~TRINITY_DN4390_c0_g2_i1.p1  ORF type:complete len:347 (+),score=84.45 TRINITY_DN4390_c0_g2_i1:313-1353(+)
MKPLEISVLFLVLIAAAAAFVNEADAVEGEMLFRKFMIAYNRTYESTAEYQLRLANFKHNMKRNIERADEPGQLATFGINKFSDLSEDEFRAMFLMPKFSPDTACRWPFHKTAETSADMLKAMPSKWSWIDRGVVTPVKNQLDCGSCWTFSTTGNIEGQWSLWGNSTLVSLSEQWIVDCSNSCLAGGICNAGCEGGLPWLAYESIIEHGGITSESQFPYSGVQQFCHDDLEHSVVAKISNWTAIVGTLEEVNAHVFHRGPLSITLNADYLMGYHSGIITGTPSQCPNSGSDHAVLLVGYHPGGKNYPPYWIVKNSWGEDWGESGYFRIQSDNGFCGANACITTSII